MRVGVRAIQGLALQLGVRSFVSPFTLAAFVTPTVLLVSMGGVSSLLRDGDTGWHIRAGQWMAENVRVPHVDLFSFTKPENDWFAWEWLWDVVMALLHQIGGMPWVLGFNTLVLSLTSAVLYQVARRQCGSCAIALGLSVIAVAGSRVHWIARPHLVTILLVIVCFALLERARNRSRTWLALLPVLEVVWANTHGAFFVGILMAALYALGALAEMIIEPSDDRRVTLLNNARFYWMAALVSCLASSINPYGFHLLQHVCRYLTDSAHLAQIAEFRSPNFQTSFAGCFELFIVLGIWAALRNGSERRITPALLVLFWMHFALVSVRNVPLFLVIAVPIVGQAVSQWLQEQHNPTTALRVCRVRRALWRAVVRVDGLERTRHRGVATVAATIMSVLVLGPFALRDLHRGYGPKRFPVDAVAALQENGSGQRIFTTYGWGGYVIYALYPGARVFIDGRSDFYWPDVTREYEYIMSARDRWADFLKEYGVDSVLLPTSSCLASIMLKSDEWHITYRDQTAVVFQRTP